MKPITVVNFTHYGWFGFCPVLLAELETGCPVIEPRWKLLPVMVASEVCVSIYMNIRRNLDPNYTPLFPILVMGKFKNPKKVLFPIEREGWDD